MLEENDKDWLKGTPFSKWIKRLEELEKKFENRIRINPSRMVCVEEAISSHLDIIKKLEKDRVAITKQIEYWGKQTEELKIVIKVLSETQDEINSKTKDNAFEIKELKEQSDEVWFRYKDKEGKLGLIHIPNVYDSVKGHREVLRELIRLTILEDFTADDVYESHYKKLLDKLGDTKPPIRWQYDTDPDVQPNPSEQVAGSARQTDFDTKQKELYKKMYKDNWEDAYKRDKEPSLYIQIESSELEWLLSAPNYGNIENEKRYYKLREQYSEGGKEDE